MRTIYHNALFYHKVVQKCQLFLISQAVPKFAVYFSIPSNDHPQRITVSGFLLSYKTHILRSKMKRLDKIERFGELFCRLWEKNRKFCGKFSF
jgi:hypothetical protein